MLDDIMFDAPTALSLEILSSRNSAPIYEYIFSYEAPFGMMKSLFHVEDGKLYELRAVNWYSFYTARCNILLVLLEKICWNLFKFYI